MDRGARQQRYESVIRVAVFIRLLLASRTQHTHELEISHQYYRDINQYRDISSISRYLINTIEISINIKISLINQYHRDISLTLSRYLSSILLRYISSIVRMMTTPTPTPSSDDEFSLDKLSTMYQDNAWLRHFGLSRDNVMDYFAVSPFYDKTCDNQYLQMQRLSMDRLATMTGIQFGVVDPPPQYAADGSLVPPSPHLFLIQKVKRESPTKGEYAARLENVVRSIELTSCCSLAVRSHTEGHVLHLARSHLPSAALVLDPPMPSRMTIAPLLLPLTSPSIQATDMASMSYDSSMPSTTSTRPYARCRNERPSRSTTAIIGTSWGHKQPRPTSRRLPISTRPTPTSSEQTTCWRASCSSRLPRRAPRVRQA